ncbi:MAG: hypothetical protein FWG69_04135 [Oscillospiraceae bacterium]|nr:hypothetical protein [Oscillospiraceae bacterium]
MSVPSAIFTYDSSRITVIDKILTFNFKSTLYEPVDVLRISFIANDIMRNNVMKNIECIITNNISFNGVVDRLTISEDRKVMTAECRSLTYALIDNQVMPAQYAAINQSSVYTTFLQPFSVTGITLFPSAAVANFEVLPGTTAWQAVISFCRRAYDTRPDIDHNRRVTISPISETSPPIVVGRSGIPCMDARYNNNRHKIISNLRYNVSDSNYNSNYSGSLVNPEMSKYGYARRRYVNLRNTWNNKNAVVTPQAIYDTNIDQHIFEVVLPGIHNIYPGLAITFDHELNHDISSGHPYQLYTGETEITADAKGARTKIKLYDAWQATY